MKRQYTCSFRVVILILLFFLSRIVRSQEVALPDLPISHLHDTPVDTFYHYEPMPGKLLGFVTDSWSVERLSQMRLQYGFTSVYTPPNEQAYNNALAAGYIVSNLLVDIFGDSYAWVVDNFPAGIYYIDEAVEHDCYGHPSAARIFTPTELGARRDYILATRPGSKFVISGYKRCSHLQIAGTYTHMVMYSSYQNWDLFGIPLCHVNMGWGSEYEGPWISGSADQRNSWTSMRNTFGTKFSMSWMHGGGDEYNQLFAHANALGLNGIFLYNGGPIDSTRLELFCSAAWQNGWLERVLGIPLPVQLASFNASLTSAGHVLLEWVTLSEINNYGFEIQRKNVVAADYQTLPNSFVPGHGTTIEPHYYSFVDSTVTPGTWFYRLKQIDLDGTVHYGPELDLVVLTSVGNQSPPDQFALYQNYPNPFNPSTRIRFDVGESSFVTLKVFDLLGEEVTTLVRQQLQPGTYETTFDAGDLSSGVYVYRMQTGDYLTTKKLLLVR